MPAPANSQQHGPVLVGQQNRQVLMHFDVPRTWLTLTGPQALAIARDLVASARAAGATPPNQRPLF